MGISISDLGDMGDFIGGIGVIITLIYLAIQIRRNTMAVRSASIDAAFTAQMEFQRTIWSDSELNKLWYSGLLGVDELDEDEGRQFFFMLDSCLRLWENGYFKIEEGSLERTAWVGLNRELGFVFAYPGVKPYWPVLKGICSEQFASFVESEVDGLT